MKVRHVMSRNPKTACPENTIAQVARLMAACNTDVVAILRGDRPIGVVTERDVVVRALAEDLSPDASVSNIMATELDFAFTDDDLAAVAERMSRLNMPRVLVLDRQGALCGMVSRGDLAEDGWPKTLRKAARAGDHAHL